MATLASQYTLTQNATVQQAIRMAMTWNANQIVIEAYDSEHVQKWTKRHELAVMVLRDPDYWLMRFVASTIANDVLTGSSTDAQIKTEVGLSFDRIAGVASND